MANYVLSLWVEKTEDIPYYVLPSRSSPDWVYGRKAFLANNTAIISIQFSSTSDAAAMKRVPKVIDELEGFDTKLIYFAVLCRGVYAQEVVTYFLPTQSTPLRTLETGFPA